MRVSSSASLRPDPGEQLRRCLDPEYTTGRSVVLEPDRGADFWQPCRAGFGPLHEHDRIVEVGLQVGPLGRGDASSGKATVPKRIGHLRIVQHA